MSPARGADALAAVNSVSYGSEMCSRPHDDCEVKFSFLNVWLLFTVNHLFAVILATFLHSD